MGYINKEYLQTQFENFASRITAVFAKTTDIPEPVNNLLATVAGSPLDAVQGKVLDDKVSKINTYVSDDGKLHFVDSEGADTELPFSSVGFTIPFTLNTTGIGMGNVTSAISYTYLTIPLEQVKHIVSAKFVSKTDSSNIYYNSSSVSLEEEIEIDYTVDAEFYVYIHKTGRSSVNAEAVLEITFK